MLMVISPAKTLDYETPPATPRFTQPEHLDHAQELIAQLRDFSPTQIAELMRGGNAYFIKNAKGNIVLMAENIKEHDRPLSGFKRRYRKAEGVKRLKRGADIPSAVLGPKVVLKKRIDVERLVAGRIPRLAAAVEKHFMCGRAARPHGMKVDSHQEASH